MQWSQRLVGQIALANRPRDRLSAFMSTRIFHLSDTHFGVENAKALESFAKAAHDEKPDLILCTGDLTQRATHEQFDAAARYFAQFAAPVMMCAGNHDMPYYNLWERFAEP